MSARKGSTPHPATGSFSDPPKVVSTLADNCSGTASRDRSCSPAPRLAHAGTADWRSLRNGLDRLYAGIWRTAEWLMTIHTVLFIMTVIWAMCPQEKDAASAWADACRVGAAVATLSKRAGQMLPFIVTEGLAGAAGFLESFVNNTSEPAAGAHEI